MASGTINSKTSLRGAITTKSAATGSMSPTASGTADHAKLTNRDALNQHPISAITDLQTELDNKVNAADFEELIKKFGNLGAKGLYYDSGMRFSKKAYWYLTSEINSITKQGDPGSNGQYIISGPYDLGAGGGGGSSVTEVMLSNKDPETGDSLWPSSVSVGATVQLDVYWSSTRDGDSTGSGTMYIYVNDSLVEKKTVKQGLVSTDISSAILSGSNKIEVKVTDAYSTSKNLIGQITGVTLQLTSSFEDDISYTGAITYTYVPVGDIEKTVYFIIDGVEQGHETIKTTGEQCAHVLPAMAHGAHNLEVYFTATLDGDLVKSNTLTYDLICYEIGNNTPIIASLFNTTEIEQYTVANIRYRVYTPGRNNSDIDLIVDGTKVGDTLSVDTTWQTWEYRPEVVGNHILTIKTGAVEKTFNVHVYESTINVEPVTANLALYLTTFGRSNAESVTERLKWQDADHNISCELSGFNWSSNGWLQDDSGTTVLRLSGDARVKIPYQPFYKDLQQTGKTIEIEFATTDVKKYESRILECLTGGDSLTYTVSLAGEDDRAKYFTVTSVDSEKFIAAVKSTHATYLFIYSGDSWTLNGNAVDLSENNEYGINIQTLDRDGTSSEYFMSGDRISVTYEVTGRGVYITPQLAKFQSQLSSLQTQYKENEHVRLAFVIEKRTENRLIYMYINGIMSGVTRYPSGDTFEQNPAADILLGSNDATLDIYAIRIYDNSLTRKQIVNNWIADMRDPVEKAVYFQDNDNFDETGKLVIAKLPSKTPYITVTAKTLPAYKGDNQVVSAEFVYPGDDSRYFTADQVSANVQGTSSQYYYRKNFKLNFKGGFNDINGEWSEKYKHMPPESKKEKKYTFKADVASSEGANNVELVRYFEDTKNFYMPAERDQDADDTAEGLVTADRIRTGINGFPIVMFHNDGTSTSFYGKMNFNNDKDNKKTFGFTDGDECWEFINNTTPLVLFQSDDLTSWQASFESRYPETAGTDEHAYGTGVGELSKLQTLMTWVASTQRLSTDSEDDKQRKLKKFKNELSDHFNVHSCLFYYLYTELFLMVDSWAKNAMLTYLHSHQTGDGGDKWYWIPYDMDTGIGTNNEGLLVFNYDAEDTDIINGAYVYNGQQSVFWNNIRDAFSSELKELYGALRSGSAFNLKDAEAKVSGAKEPVAWSYDNIEKMFEDHQAYWSASIFNEDSYTKYLEPLIENNDATYLGMAQGSKSEQRKWWLYNRFKYLDSKYRTGDAQGQYIMLRAYQRDDLHLTPYINCYVTAAFDQQVDDLMVTKKAEKDTEITIVPPDIWDPATKSDEGSEGGGSDSVVTIFSADLLRDVGDLSGFKPGYADFSRATKLQKLVIGNADASYTNNKLTTLSVGNNKLLTYIDARNCSALGIGTEPGSTKTIDLSGCVSIEEAYFDNTNIQGLSLPVGGNLKKLHLPASITDLTIRNHPNLTELVLAGTSKLTSVWLENIPSSVISAVKMVMSMSDGSTVRLIDINESVDSEDDIELFYTKLDKMKGRDAKGDTTDAAQVTGAISVDSIAYAHYVELTARYPEIKINANKIICTVNFFNEGVLFKSQSVIQGKDADNPGIPTKAASADGHYYYTFNSWDKSYLSVQTDLDINAIFDTNVQVYRLFYVTRSVAIATPAYEDIKWGEYAHSPELSNIPDEVQFTGWYTADDILFDFNEPLKPTPESLSLYVYAHWNDPSAPVVSLKRKSFNTFTYTAADNVGISAWACTQESTIATDSKDWHIIEPIAEFTGDYEISNSGDYYFYVRDDQGNVSSAKIHSNKISYDLGTGVNSIDLSENDVAVTTYALTGSILTVNATIDEHYENLSIEYLAIKLNIGDTFVVSSDVTISATVTPKTYIVTFITKTHGYSPDSQSIVYLHTVVEPDPQIEDGYVLSAWCKDETLKLAWDFQNDVVTDNTTLYAKWVEYKEPTVFNISTDEANQIITFNFEQTSIDGLEVDWGDGSAIETSDTAGQIAMTHTYAETGTYQISATKRTGEVYFGKDETAQTIVPITALSDVIFSWDVPTTKPYAFYKAVNLPTARLTRFMTRIADHAFDSCTGLSGSLEIPDSIIYIGDGAFESCGGLNELILPAKLSQLGDNAFDNCTKLTTVTFNSKSPLKSISSYAFNNCLALTAVNFSPNIISISDYAFANCTALESVTVPETITNLGYNVFYGDLSLSQVNLLAKSMTFHTAVFQNCPQLLTAGPYNSTGDQSYNIAFNWSSAVPAFAFAMTSNTESYITSVTLPDNIKGIGQSAFYLCTKLASVELPPALEKLEAQAFFFCLSLSEITVPKTVTYIGSNAFGQCWALTKIKLWNRSSSFKVMLSTDSWFLQSNKDTIIHIPAAIKLDYVTDVYGTYWNYFSDDLAIAYINDLE